MEWLLDVLWIIDDDWFLNLEPPWGVIVSAIYAIAAFWLFAIVFLIIKDAIFGHPDDAIFNHPDDVRGRRGVIIENWAGIMRTGTFVLVLLITLKVYGCIGE